MAIKIALTVASVLTLFAATAYGGIGPVAELVISNADVNLDGFTRAATVVNGAIDRTIITANLGDTFQLNVVNQLNDTLQYQTTSIHWHGILQKASSWADGPAFVTQCPISKGNSFLYTFNADVAGTWWYHSHMSVQYCDGARGALVVYDRNDPHKDLYDVDNDDTVITLSDWYHPLSKSLVPGGPIPDSTLINGRARSTADLTAPLSVISVTTGTRYRFRVVNTGCDANFVFEIDGHSFTIIAVDGTPHQPMTVTSFQLFAGQRIDVVMTADQEVGNYWVRAKPNIGADTSFDSGRNSAILRYEGAAEAEPTTTQRADPTAMVEQNLKPLTAVAVPGTAARGGVTTPFDLTIGFSAGQFTINNNSFVHPTIPALLQILSGTQSAQSLLPSGSYLNVEQGGTVEMVIRGGAVGAPHPFHLHGHTFHVIRSAGSTVDNYVDPPLRDVVSTGVAGDEVTIRFNVDNPGPWFLHCHIDWHLEAGLALIMVEDIPGLTSLAAPPASWDDLCPIYNEQVPEDLRRRQAARSIRGRYNRA